MPKKKGSKLPHDILEIKFNVLVGPERQKNHCAAKTFWSNRVSNSFIQNDDLFSFHDNLPYH